jgi:hypothetical protein
MPGLSKAQLQMPAGSMLQGNHVHNASGIATPAPHGLLLLSAAHTSTVVGQLQADMGLS